MMMKDNKFHFDFNNGCFSLPCLSSIIDRRERMISQPLFPLFFLFLLVAPLSQAFAPPSQRKQPFQNPLQATWSDSRAIKEYQDFLATGKQEIDKAPDGPCVIVRPAEGDYTELADALVKLGDGEDMLLSPGEELPDAEIGAYPIYITLPPFELKSFLQNLPSSFVDRDDDFVFISGGKKYGNIEQVLKDTGNCRDAMTQFLWTGMDIKQFTIEDKAVNLGLDGYGEEKFAGECAACGKWAGHIEERLEKNAIRVKTVFYREWRRMMVSWDAKKSVFQAFKFIAGADSTRLVGTSDIRCCFQPHRGRSNRTNDTIRCSSVLRRGSL